MSPDIRYEMPQLIVPDTVTSYVSRFLRGVNICQGGGCCSMWLILSERYIEKNGQIWEWSGVEQWHLPFKLVFLLLWANDRLREEGVRWHHPPWYGSGVFLTFHYLRVSINTLLCNPNFRYSESLLPCSHGCR